MLIEDFGTPISIGDAKQYIKDYYSLYKAAVSELSKLSDCPNIVAFLAAQRQILSGIYGKNRIMQILDQNAGTADECKGIRYALGMYEEAVTIVLMGVKSNGDMIPDPGVEEEAVVLDSLPDWQNTPSGQGRNEFAKPVIIEIHKASMDADTLKTYLNL